MGGYGSGRWYRWDARDTVEQHRRLDVRKLHKAGYLEGDDTPRPWGWRSGEELNWVTIRARANLLTLSYRWRINGGEWQGVEQPVRITWTHPTYGGRRPWFLCPGVVNGVHCQRRVALLYGAGRYFACRRCFRLAYTCTREGKADRGLRRANKIRRRLAGESEIANSFPSKPKGMHWSTYDRLRMEANQAELQSMRLMLGEFRAWDRMVARRLPVLAASESARKHRHFA
jgi:hypothetical protein